MAAPTVRPRALLLLVGALLTHVPLTTSSHAHVDRGREDALQAATHEPSWFLKDGTHLSRHKLARSPTGYLEGSTYSQFGEDRLADEKFFRGATGGVYLELGALDGLALSNTKAFEAHRGWRGLLIEPNPELYKQLVLNRPESINVNAAICSHRQTVHFTSSGAVSGIWEFMSPFFRKHFYQGGPEVPEHAVPIQCVPLNTLLERYGMRHINFFSLDVEGAEFEVLKTFNFEHVKVDVFVVEQDGSDPVKDQNVRALLAQHGYVQDTTMPKLGVGSDWFVHQDSRLGDSLE